MEKKWNKKIIVDEIRKLRRAGEKMNPWHIQQHHHPLYLAARTYWGSYKKAVRAAGYSYERTLKVREATKWSRTKIVQVIQELHHAGEKINSNHIQLHHQSLYAAAVNYFRSWGKAIEAAGYDYAFIRVMRPFRLWSKTNIIKTIQSRHRKRLLISGNAVYSQDRGLYLAATRYLGRGGWSKALRLAGFDPKQVNTKAQQRKQTMRWVKREIQRLRRARTPLYGYWLFRNGFEKLYSAGDRLFGSWGKAIEAAGLNYEKIRATKQWSKRKVLAEIRRLERRGVRLSQKEVTHKRHLYGLFQAAIFRFGSWGQAVVAAGFDYRKHCSRWTYKSWLRSLTPQKLKGIKQRVTKFTRKERVKR